MNPKKRKNTNCTQQWLQSATVVPIPEATTILLTVRVGFTMNQLQNAPVMLEQ
jgi:hypothetical protein